MFFFHRQLNLMRQLSESIHIHPELALIRELLSLLWPSLTDTAQSSHRCWTQLQLYDIWSAIKVHTGFTQWQTLRTFNNDADTYICILYCVCSVRLCSFVCACMFTRALMQSLHVVSFYDTVAAWFSMCSKERIWNVKAAIPIKGWNRQTITHSITNYMNIKTEWERHKHSHSLINTHLHYFVHTELISS